MNVIINIGMRAGILSLGGGGGASQAGIGVVVPEKLSSVHCLWAGVRTRGPKAVSAP